MKIRLLLLIFGCLLGSFEVYGQKVVQVEVNSQTRGLVPSKQWLTNLDSAEYLVDQILQTKLNEGYLEAGWKVDLQGDTSYYRLSEGKLYSWSKIQLVDDSLGFDLGFEDSVNIPYPKPYQVLEQWLSLREKSGFPFAQAQLQVVSMTNGLLQGLIQLDPGPFITWDSLEVKGNTKTQRKYLQRFSGITPGTPFSQDRYEQAVKKIGANTYFTWESEPELQFRTRQAVPVFSLRDRRINVFDGIVGFLPNANEPGRLLVTGQVDLRLFHLGGKGREAGLQWQKLNQQSQSLDVRFKERFLLGSPLDVEVTFSLLKQDSSFVNRNFGIDFGLQITERNYLTFFHRRQSGDLITVDSEGADLGELVDFRWNHYGVRWDWSDIDQPESPRRGSRFQSEVSVGNKRIIENTGIPQEAYDEVDQSSPQIQAKVTAEKNLYVKPRYGVWLNFSAGHIQNQNLFLNELFRLGGLKSIRGFYETFFFAQSFGYLNMEHRLYLDSRSYLMVFSDVGVLSNPFSSPRLNRPVSFGSGINLDTGGGLFSFVVAVGKSNEQPMSFSYSRVHFGYLARF